MVLLFFEKKVKLFVQFTPLSRGSKIETKLSISDRKRQTRHFCFLLQG
jgi:hypothetical protein